MSYENMLKDIKNNNLKRVYLCYGKEGYLKDWIIDELKKKYVDKAFETLNYVHIDGRETDVEGIINACETLPFMSDKKIVIVEDIPFLTSGRGGNVAEEDKLRDYIPTLSSSTCLVFLVSDGDVDKRKKLVKAIKTTGAIIELNKVKDKELIKWVEKTFRENSKKIMTNDIYHFIQGVGYLEANSEKSLYDLENEIMKICSYVGDREQILREDIDKSLAKTLQNNLFRLLDDIGRKNPKNALLILNEMIIDNEPIQKITYMIIRQFRLLFQAKLFIEKGYSVQDVTKKLGIHPYSAKKIIEQSSNYSSKELQNIIMKCLDIDAKVKKGKIDNKLAIEALIVEITG